MNSRKALSQVRRRNPARRDDAHHDTLFAALGELLLRDLTIGDPRTISGKHLDGLCASLLDYIKPAQIVYTAFDGDQLHLCRHMRTTVLASGAIPANPESILGYRHCVLAHLTKKGVIMDDLAILQGCDDLWLFADGHVTPNALLASLAEGAIVELLFFKKRRSHTPVLSINTTEMLRSGRAVHRQTAATYEDLVDALDAEQRAAVLALANSGTRVDKELRPLVFFITDPLDFKYAEWLRATAYQSQLTPLVPGLAVEMGDFEWASSPIQRLGRAVAAWATLMRLATQSTRLDAIEPTRPPSLVASLLERCWLRLKSGPTPTIRSWRSVGVPKASYGVAWPLTPREQRAMADHDIQKR
jgi:hypothetical protein